MKWKWQIEFDRRIVKEASLKREVEILNELLPNPVYVMRVFIEILIHHNKLREFRGTELKLKNRGYLSARHFTISYYMVELYYKWNDEYVIWEVSVRRKGLVDTQTLFRFWL